MLAQPDSTDADMPRMTPIPGAWPLPLHWLRQHPRRALACAIVASRLDTEPFRPQRHSR